MTKGVRLAVQQERPPMMGNLQRLLLLRKALGQVGRPGTSSQETRAHDNAEPPN